MSKKIESIFFDSWSEARQAFIAGIHALGGICEDIPIGQNSPEGAKLSIGTGLLQIGCDQALIGKNLLIHISGVHGVEGFAGSAAQLGILDELLDYRRSGKWSELPSCTVLFIHSVNPYGMSWLRRNNANNVDLNRNTIDPMGRSRPSAYSEIHSILLDHSIFGRLWVARLGLLLMRRGRQFVLQGLSGGQYEFANGFFYGGEAHQQELLLLKNYLSERMASFQNVFALDIHTGLGPFAFESLFAAELAQSPDIASINRDLGVELTVDEINGTSTYRSLGSFSNLIYDSFPGARVRYILQEFGTFNGFSILRGLRCEHLAWLRGEFGPDRMVSMRLKTLFFPEDSGWRRKVLVDASRLFFKVLTAGFN